MSIDRFYQVLGGSIKRVWHRIVARPVKNFNVENRAYDQIERKQAAPWHDSTRQAVRTNRNEMSSSFAQLNNHNQSLVDRLKEVKVSTGHEQPEELVKEEDPKSKLPKERFGFDLPYVFFKPEKIPPGKIAVLDLLEMLVTREKDQLSSQELANLYSVKVEDVDNIVKWVDIFAAVDKNQKEVQMFQKLSDAEALQLDAHNPQPEKPQPPSSQPQKTSAINEK